MSVDDESKKEILKTLSDEDLAQELSSRIRHAPAVSGEMIDQLNFLLKEAKAKTTPEKPKVADKEVERWVGILNNQGMGCLQGKFMPGWIAHGKTIDKAGLQATGGFGDQGFEAVDIYSPAYSFFAQENRLLTDTAQKVQESNYLVVAPVKDSKTEVYLTDKLGLKGDWSAMDYVFWVDKNSYRTDNLEQYKDLTRNHHIPMHFSFILPTSEMAELAKAVKENPDLIETLFQTFNPDLNADKGFKRLAVDKLRMMEIDQYVFIEDPGGKKLDIVNRSTPLPFSKTVGESQF